MLHSLSLCLSPQPSTNRRAASEQISQLRALHSRRNRGLALSEAEEVRLAQLMAQHKGQAAHLFKSVSGNKKDELADDCIIM